MKKYATNQPKDGDRVAHCGHLDAEDAPFHFFVFKATYTRPNGMLVKTKWLVCCNDCFKATGGEPTIVPVRGDFVWSGNAPIILAK